jgi:hypothetical protein
MYAPCKADGMFKTVAVAKKFELGFILTFNEIIRNHY